MEKYFYDVGFFRPDRRNLWIIIDSNKYIREIYPGTAFLERKDRMEKSIYQIICDHISDGILPADFSLPDENKDKSPIRWAPGALDGAYFYHGHLGGVDDAGTKQMARALKTAAAGSYKEAEKLFVDFTGNHSAIDAVDSMQQYILDHAKRLDAGNIFRAGLYMILHSTHIECVKIGLELLELFEITEENIREIICRLALYPEFSLYAVWNMRKWDDGNPYIFELAKKVHGWGRIHAVENLEPETEEIRHWLLTEGTINDITNDYSALTCWQKSDAEKILFGCPTEEEYKGLSLLIDGLISEGPVPGISEIENAEQVLLRFLEITPNYDLTVSEYDVILSVLYWADEDDKPVPAVAAKCKMILHSSACTAVVTESVKEGEGLRLADELDIPFHADLFNCMQRNFDRFYYHCHYLMDDPDFAGKTMDLFRERLPLAEIGGEPIKDVGYYDARDAKYDQLQAIILELIDKPLVGTVFITAGLRSPLSRNRYWALEILKSWVQEKGIPLADLSPELYAVVGDLRPKEISEECLKSIEQLLSGQIKFDEGDEEKYDG